MLLLTFRHNPCSLIVERWQKWAAETAVLEDGGKAFAAVAGARKVKRQRAAEPAVE